MKADFTSYSSWTFCALTVTILYTAVSHVIAEFMMNRTQSDDTRSTERLLLPETYEVHHVTLSAGCNRERISHKQGCRYNQDLYQNFAATGK